MDTDRNLLFGVLALQLDLIEPAQFAEACSAWAARKDKFLADILVERGWLKPADRTDVEKLLDRKLQRHGGDAAVGLAETIDDRVRRSLHAAVDPDIRRAVAKPAPPPMGRIHVSLSAMVPDNRGRYTLSRLHATGGIGRVWLAHDTALGRNVALKDLRPERISQPAILARFLHEAQITGQLEHPGIVPIYEVSRGPDEQAPFYTMRFVHGLTLSEAVAAFRAKRSRGEAGPLALRELLGAFVGVCNAVAYAHARGVIHRDLKPRNVMLGDFGEVIVLDWGLAKVVGGTDPDGLTAASADSENDAEATKQGDVLGTPAYMAPEQAAGRLDQIGAATDVFGLGAILYEILTGRPPRSGSAKAATPQAVVDSTPARPRSLDAAAPPALEAICLKALAKNPEERYATAKELASDVQHWLAGEPVSVYREPWPVRAGRWVKRHRMLVTGAAAAGAAALVGLAVILIVQARANQELRAANEREQARFDLAMDAVKTLHAGVGEDDLLKQPEFEGLRAKVLHQAKDFYEKLETQLQGQGDRRSRTELGKAFFELGELTAKIGSKEEALAVHQRGLAVRQALADEAGAGPEAKADRAESLLAVGNLLDQTGKLEDALTTDEKAKDVLQALAAARPDFPRFQGDLGKCHFQIGAVLWQKDRTQEAAEAFERAKDVQKPLAEAHPETADYRNDLAVSYARIGAAQGMMGDLDAAMASYERAREIQEALATANPSVPRYQVRLAVTERYEGGVLESMGKRGDAAVHFERSRNIREALVKAHPAVTEYRERLARSCMEISRELNLSGKPDEALAAMRQGRELFLALGNADPSVPEYPKSAANYDLSIADLLAETGKPEEALTTIEGARRVFHTLADSHGGGPYCRDELEEAAHGLGELQLDRGRPDKAADALAEARSLAQAAVDAHSSAPDDVSALAGVEIDRGRLAFQSGRSADALASFERARELCGPLANGRPNVPLYQEQLARSLTCIGDVFRSMNRADDARARYEQAAAIQEALLRTHPETPEVLGGLAFTLRRLGAMRQAGGKAAEAAGMFRRAFDLYQQAPPHISRQLCEQAACQALLSGVAAAPGAGVTADEGRAAADKAMTLLKQAVALGYRNLDALRIDPGLDPLRQRADFQAMMKNLKLDAK